MTGLLTPTHPPSARKQHTVWSVQSYSSDKEAQLLSLQKMTQIEALQKTKTSILAFKFSSMIFFYCANFHV